MLLDPPIVIANEVKEAVRRLRWTQAGNTLPGLVSTMPDVGAANNHQFVTIGW